MVTVLGQRANAQLPSIGQDLVPDKTASILVLLPGIRGYSITVNLVFMILLECTRPYDSTVWRVLGSRFKVLLTNATNSGDIFWHQVRGEILACEA